MTFLARRLLWLVIFLSIATTASAEGKPPLVLAAASLQESLTAVAQAWASRGHPQPLLSFGASSALARQIESGAPADLFISADEDWVDELQSRKLVRPGSRVSFLDNRLVLIAPKASRLSLPITRGFPIARALGSGRLAIADPTAVPAGKYAKAALTRLGVWQAVEPKLAPAENVRAALAFVERAEVPLGIVYETDAIASTKVRIIGRFPANSHPRISYPVVVLRSSTNLDAEGFRQFLIASAGKSIFRRFGFGTR